MFEFEENLAMNAKIKVIGIGGGGGNAIKTMMREQVEGVDFVAVNTDLQALQQNEAMVKIQIGHKLTRGLGAGSNPNVGRDAAMEDCNTISEVLEGSDMVFITAGMGGGTGTGAAPVIANIAREMGILTVGVVTKPFSFEGRKRMKQAELGISELMKEVDTLICVPNDNLLNIAGKDTPMLSSFKMVDQVLLQAVRGISDLITIPGLINLDFSDVKAIMNNAGVALMGTGVAAGDNRAIEAAKLAISSPLLEDVSISGAKGILLNITGSSNTTLFEVNEASKLIQQECHEDANIIFGAVIDENLGDEIRVTVMATGFNHEVTDSRKEDPKPTSIKKPFSYKGWTKNQKEPLKIDRRTMVDYNEEEEVLPIFDKNLNIKDVVAETANDEFGMTVSQSATKETPASVNQSETIASDDSVSANSEENLSLPFQAKENSSSDNLDFNASKPTSFGSFAGESASVEAGLAEVQFEDKPKAQVPSRKQIPNVWGSDKETVSESQNSKSQFSQKKGDKKYYQDSNENPVGEDEYDIPAFIRRRAD